MEAISMAGTVLAILSKEGVVMVAEKVRTSGIDIYTDFIWRCIAPAPNRKWPVNCLIFLWPARVGKVWRLGRVVVPKRSSSSTSRWPYQAPVRRARITLLKLSSAAFNSNILAGVAGITSDANSLVNYARTAAQKHLFSYDEEIPVEMLAQRLCDLKQGYTQYGGKSVERVCYPS
jgi:hypothetical protein